MPGKSHGWRIMQKNVFLLITLNIFCFSCAHSPKKEKVGAMDLVKLQNQVQHIVSLKNKIQISHPSTNIDTSLSISRR